MKRHSDVHKRVPGTFDTSALNSRTASFRSSCVSPAASHSRTLAGQIERVTYHNPENGFAVLRVKVRGQQDLVTVLGNLTSVTAGEHLEASGRWVIDREHVRQFRAEQLKTTHPATAEGIERYLGSGAIRSVGPILPCILDAVIFSSRRRCLAG